MLNIKKLQEQRKGLVEQLKAAETMEDLEKAKADLEEVDTQIKMLNEKSALVERLGAQGEPVKTVATSKASPSASTSSSSARAATSLTTASSRRRSRPLATPPRPPVSRPSSTILFPCVASQLP